MKPIFYIIDGNNIAMRALFTTGQKVKKGFFFLHFMQILQSTILPSYNPDNYRFIFCWDSGEPTIQKKLFTEYKVHRLPTGEPFHLECRRSKKVLTKMGMLQCQIPGIEADDIIGFVSRGIQRVYPHCKTVIVSNDKDLLQLLSDDSIEQHSIKPHSNNDTAIWTEEHFKEVYGISPQYWPVVKAYTGDPSDNIPGINGVGIKTALKIIKREPNIYKAIRNSDVCNVGAGARKLYLNGELEKILLRNLALVTIRRRLKQFIDPEHREQLRTIAKDIKALDDKLTVANKDKMQKILNKSGIRKYSGDEVSWLLNSGAERV